MSMFEDEFDINKFENESQLEENDQSPGNLIHKTQTSEMI
jgi:hypothetical protein